MAKKKPTVKVASGDNMKYVSAVPRKVPKGSIVCHNHVQPQEIPGINGFRVFLVPVAEIDSFEECKCGWADHLPKHYKGKKETTKKPAMKRLSLHDAYTDDDDHFILVCGGQGGISEHRDCGPLDREVAEALQEALDKQFVGIEKEENEPQE